MQLGAGLASLYFTVALVLMLAQAHASAVAGQPRRLAEVAERLTPLVVCLAVAVSAPSVGGAIAGAISGGVPSDAASAIVLWRSLARVVIGIVIASVGASLSAGIALGAFSAQITLLLGQPNGVASVGARIGLTTLTAMLTLASVALADAVLRAAN